VKKNNQNSLLLKQPLWLLMAVLCIVFSSASKRLIEVRAEQRFSHNSSASPATSKKIKDGSRDKRQFLQTFIQSEKNADSSIPEFLFFLSALVFLSFISSGVYNPVSFTKQPVISSGAIPLYLQVRKLQV